MNLNGSYKKYRILLREDTAWWSSASTNTPLKIATAYESYKKHGRGEFLEIADYYSNHVHPNGIDKTIDEMESRWSDSTNRQTEAEKMTEDYNNSLTVLNYDSLVCADAEQPIMRM